MPLVRSPMLIQGSAASVDRRRDAGRYADTGVEAPRSMADTSPVTPAR